MKIVRNPFSDLVHGDQVWIKFRTHGWVVTEFIRTKGMQVLVYDPMVFLHRGTKDSILVDVEDVERVEYIRPLVIKPRRKKIRIVR